MQVRLIEQQTKKELEDARLKAQANIEGTKLGAKIAYDKDKLRTDTQIEGARIGVDIAKNKAQQATTRHVAEQRKPQVFKKDRSTKGE